METSIIFLLGALRGIRTGAVLAVNTYEPVELVEKDPSAIYELEERAREKGEERAIKVALEATSFL